MKRFSKIFCIALVAIIFGTFGLLSFNKNNLAIAATNYPDLCKPDGRNSLAGGTITYLQIPDSCTIEKPCTTGGFCYSKAVQDLVRFYNILKPSDPLPPETQISKIDSFITIALTEKNLLSLPVTQHYQSYKTNLPDNVIRDTETMKAQGKADPIIYDFTTDLANASLLVDSKANPIAKTVIENPLESSECANNSPSFWAVLTNPIESLFRAINIGIIWLTTTIIKMGVNTMGWLMQPNNLWAPGISNNPAVIQAFGASVSVVNIVFSVVLIMMAIGTILNLKSYKINDLITKFIIVALLINFTLVIAGSILDLANYISLYFYNATLKSIQSGTLTDKWTEILTNKGCLSGTASSTGRMFTSIFINSLVFIAIAAAMLSVCGSLLKRGIMLMFLLIISPFAVICYLLPAKGMGQWWEKWKTSFLKQTFYGVYVSVGFYLGTIMLSALSISNQLSDDELSFASGIIKPILAAGYLVFIVMLADEVAGGSAKASITGATKLALGLAAGGVVAGAVKAKTAITTSEGFDKFASRLNTKTGFGWIGKAALGQRTAGLEERDKQNAAADAIINARDIETNGKQFRKLIKSGDISSKAVHAKVVLAQKLLDTKRWDLADDKDDKEKTTSKRFNEEIGTIFSDANITKGVVTQKMKSSLKDANPMLFLLADYAKEFTKKGFVKEQDVQEALTEAHGNITKATEKLISDYKGNDDALGDIHTARQKYIDNYVKVLNQFAKYDESADGDVILETLLKADKDMQASLISNIADDPVRLRHIYDQVTSSKAKTTNKDSFTNLASAYIMCSNKGGMPGPADDPTKYDKIGSYKERQYSRKQWEYIIENMPRLDTPDLPPATPVVAPAAPSASASPTANPSTPPPIHTSKKKGRHNI